MSALRLQRLRNLLHALVLLGGMAGLTLGVGWMLGGPLLATIAAGVGMAVFLAPGLANARLVLRLHGARPLLPGEAPRLQDYLRRLADRAGLPRTPVLCTAPGAGVNAFATGDPASPVIVLSEGLLRELPEDEAVGVMAHEVAHLLHDDVRLMRVADTCRRLADTAVHLVLFTLLLNIPLLLQGAIRIPLALLLLLLGLPTLQAVLQLAFSRSREHAADLAAAELMGDPVPLARALARLDAIDRRPLPTIFGPVFRQRDQVDPWLRSHPETRERVRRLEDYGRSLTWPHPPLVVPPPAAPPRRSFRLGPFLLRWR